MVIRFLLWNKSTVQSTTNGYESYDCDHYHFHNDCVIVFSALYASLVQHFSCELHHKHYSNLSAEQ